MIKRLLIALVHGYRLTLSPWIGNACRFTPTCSAYSLDALERHGAAAGDCGTVLTPLAALAFALAAGEGALAVTAGLPPGKKVAGRPL